MSIIIVDDDRSIRYLYKTYLNSQGYHIIGLAKNGLEAIQLVKETSIPPDIILIDYRMPILNGVETIKEILKINLNYKFILFSADARISQKARYLGIPFLEKPISLEELHVKIQNVLKNPDKYVTLEF